MLPILPTGEKIHLSVPNNGISDEGQQAIIAYLFDDLKVRVGNHCADGPQCPVPSCANIQRTQLKYALAEDNFEWVWKAGRGTLPKRMAALWRKRGHKLPDDAISQLGNLASVHTEKHAEHVFDFTQDFSWYRGDFGDDDSCFWSERLGAKEMLHNMDSYAIRFWEPGNEYNGLARAWLVPREDDGFFVLFNAYSKSGWNYDALTISRILAFYLGQSYRKVDPLLNNNDGDGRLWINGRVKADYSSERIPHGYLVGPVESIVNVSEYDFDEPQVWDEADDDEDDDDDRYYCECCDNRIGWDQEVRGPNDCYYCQSCYEDLFVQCDRCEEDVRRDDSTNIDDGDHIWCDDCTGDHATHCDNCGGYFSDGTSGAAGTGYFCHSCWNERFSHCDECDAVCERSDLTDGLCSECTPAKVEEEEVLLEATA
ncbi:MAG: hypothetical protein ACYC63_04655 [Armatimonadota bacterium]